MSNCTPHEAERIDKMTLQQLLRDVYSIDPTKLHSITVKQNKLLAFILEAIKQSFCNSSVDSPSFGLVRITTDEFLKKHDLCTHSALSRFNRTILKGINIIAQGRWMIDEDKTLLSLMQSTIIRNRMKKNPEKYGHLFK